MNLLKNSICYTVGPLEYGCFDNARQWRQYVKEQLKTMNIRVLSPLKKMFKNFQKEGVDFQAEIKQALKEGKYDWVREQMTQVRNRDLAACDISTFIIAVIQPNTMSWGSCDEIITSKRNQKPVFLVIPNVGYEGIPLWLSSYFKPNWVYKSIDEVLEVICKIDKGEIQVNNKYWKILDAEEND